MKLSQPARLVSGLTIILVPTIAYGGTFLLSLYRQSDPTFLENEVYRAFFRAGHAHAGVLVILGLVAQILADNARLPRALTWLTRIGFFVAPMLISAGFFLAAPVETREPGQMVSLIYVGTVILIASLIALGIGLIRPRRGVESIASTQTSDMLAGGQNA